MNLELFCCSGGMAEGFRRAGIAFDLAFDANPDACASYEANLGHRPVQMDVRDLLRMARAGWRPEGGVGLLVADPPCTPWSCAGKREGTADPRDMLRETAALIAELRPRAYMIGNVPGLDTLSNLPVVQEVIGGLSKHGYCTADHARLDAADFGVPQHRIRPFWFGHLAGPCIRWPGPTHGDPADVRAPHLPGVEPLKPWVACREALGHLPLEELGRPIRLRAITATGGRSGQAKVRPWRNGPQSERVYPLDEPAPCVQARTDRVRNGAVTLALTPNAKHPINEADRPSRDGTARSRGAQGSSALAWPWDVAATTLCARDVLSPPGRDGRTSGSQRMHPDAVILSERAGAILQGFPDPGAPGGWKFVGRTKKSRWGQIGMAMPPALAEAVARSVRAQMEATGG
ncbi:MAG: DNA cytosine methyltransferase [Myxococcota bacterium]|nr:DNA cytosine methyltransferase [Myxococcota bacterium]